MIFCNLVLFFSIYSFLGWLLETIFKSISEGKFVNRGFLTGCFCPIHGFGAIMTIEIYNLVNNAFTNHVIVFIIAIIFSILATTALEYITGYSMDIIYDFKWWDYSDEIANIQGYICLKYSLMWGCLAFILIIGVHPIILRIVNYIPASIKELMKVSIILYFIADTIMSSINALDLREIIYEYLQVSINYSHEKIIKYKRFLFTLPHLSILNARLLNYNTRGILNERIERLKFKFKDR